MKNSLKQPRPNKSYREKSIKEIMDNAYKIAKNSGFYIPFRNCDRYGLKGTQDNLD
ncbi:hypothetical protein [Psychroserpens sp. SPM9]|uniref:hypothetical protein n=1 Tax=Psychroserpens sp. SPM9 TaxID=2975598 RepID=UPI0021A82350|nr:hypothetical protein [Psychroserpens sp. SPM9]MDG5491284.1 hypothetical protein [Psychroserpens sp. SPM9]